MTPAVDSPSPPQAAAAAATPQNAVSPRTASESPAEAVVTTLEGRAIALGRIEFDGDDTRWIATLSRMEPAGALASHFFARRVRDVIVRLADGRRARARIVGTSFAGKERVARLAGSERFA